MFKTVPQLLKNVRHAKGRWLESAAVKAAIANAEAKLTGRGRLVARNSGTKPLTRVMAESDDLTVVETLVGRRSYRL